MANCNQHLTNIIITALEILELTFWGKNVAYSHMSAVIKFSLTKKPFEYILIYTQINIIIKELYFRKIDVLVSMRQSQTVFLHRTIF